MATPTKGPRRLHRLYDAYHVGEVVEAGGAWWVVTRCGERRVTDEDPSVLGSDLLGYEGEILAWAEARPATDDEAEPAREAEAQRQAARQAERERAAQRSVLKGLIERLWRDGETEPKRALEELAHCPLPERQLGGRFHDWGLAAGPARLWVYHQVGMDLGASDWVGRSVRRTDELDAEVSAAVAAWGIAWSLPEPGPEPPLAPGRSLRAAFDAAYAAGADVPAEDQQERGDLQERRESQAVTIDGVEAERALALRGDGIWRRLCGWAGALYGRAPGDSWTARWRRLPNEAAAALAAAAAADGLCLVVHPPKPYPAVPHGAWRVRVGFDALVVAGPECETWLWSRALPPIEAGGIPAVNADGFSPASALARALAHIVAGALSGNEPQAPVEEGQRRRAGRLLGRLLATAPREGERDRYRPLAAAVQVVSRESIRHDDGSLWQAVRYRLGWPDEAEEEVDIEQPWVRDPYTRRPDGQLPPAMPLVRLVGGHGGPLPADAGDLVGLLEALRRDGGDSGRELIAWVCDARRAERLPRATERRGQTRVEWQPWRVEWTWGTRIVRVGEDEYGERGLAEVIE